MHRLGFPSLFGTLPFFSLLHSGWIFEGYLDSEMEKDGTNENPEGDSDVPSAVQLAVGGMTCVACARTITDAVSELEGVTEISVNQLGKSASAVVARTSLVDSVVTLIEDIGYECYVISIIPIKSADYSGRVDKTRTVALEFKGMESV